MRSAVQLANVGAGLRHFGLGIHSLMQCWAHFGTPSGDAYLGCAMVSFIVGSFATMLGVHLVRKKLEQHPEDRIGFLQLKWLGQTIAATICFVATWLSVGEWKSWGPLCAITAAAVAFLCGARLFVGIVSTLEEADDLGANIKANRLVENFHKRQAASLERARLQQMKTVRAGLAAAQPQAVHKKPGPPPPVVPPPSELEPGRDYAAFLLGYAFNDHGLVQAAGFRMPTDSEAKLAGIRSLDGDEPDTGRQPNLVTGVVIGFVLVGGFIGGNVVIAEHVVGSHPAVASQQPENTGYGGQLQGCQANGESTMCGSDFDADADGFKSYGMIEQQNEPNDADAMQHHYLNGPSLAPPKVPTAKSYADAVKVYYDIGGNLYSADPADKLADPGAP